MKFLALFAIAFAMLSTAVPNVARAGESGSSLAIRQWASSTLKQCSSTICFAEKSLIDKSVPEDIGRLLREGCDTMAGCWTSSLGYIAADHPVPVEDLESYSRYKIGMVVTGCTSTALKPAERTTCFFKSLKVLTAVAGSWRASYLSLVQSECPYFSRTGQDDKGNDIYSQDDDHGCYQNALMVLVNADSLPVTKEQDDALRLKILKEGCTKDYWTCWNQGLATMELPFLEAEILRAGCNKMGDDSTNDQDDPNNGSLGWSCYSKGISFLMDHARPADTIGNTKYTAGLILTSCSFYANQLYAGQDDGEGDRCIQNSLLALETVQGKNGLTLRSQDIQTAMRPLLEVSAQCKDSSDFACYYKTLNGAYNSL